MKPFLLILALTLFCIKGYSQTADDPSFFRTESDTSKTSLRILNYIKDSRYWGNKNEIAFRNKMELKLFADSNKFDLPDRYNEINDPTTSIALISYSGIDCHSSFNFRFERDDAEKTYRLFIYIMNGGCRAGGNNYTRWISFSKIPEDYRFVVLEAVIKDN